MSDLPRKITPIHEEEAERASSRSVTEDSGVVAMDTDLSGVELRRADMNRVFEATLELLDQVDDPQELFNAILEEYSRRLDQFPGASILPRAGHEMNQEQKQQLSLLILFSSQAVLLKEKAQLFSRLRNKHQEVKKSTLLLSDALNDAEEVKNLLQSTLESLPSGVVVLDREGSPLFLNTEAETLLALNPALIPPADVYRKFLDVEPEIGRQAVASLFSPEIEVEGPAGNRTIHRKLVRVPPMPERKPVAILLLEDVTEERRLRDEILRNGRLTAVLDTWAALNHEINNPLAAILGRAQILLARSAGLDEKTVAGLKVIEDSALRIVDLAGRLKELTSPTFKEYSRGVTMLDIPASKDYGRKKAG